MISGLHAFRAHAANEQAINDVLENVSQSLFNYIHSPNTYSKEEFDNLHQDISMRFMNSFNQIIEGQASTVSRKNEKTGRNEIVQIKMSGIRYGQAQKLINLSFKWLYCMDGE